MPNINVLTNYSARSPNPMHTELTIDRDDWTPELEKYLARWKDLTPVQRKASKVVHDSIAQAYATGGASTGHSWPPRKSDETWPPLIRTGKMKAMQLAASAGVYSEIGNEKIIDYSGVIFEATPYAKFHQFGAPGAHLPARPTLALTEQELDEMTQIVADYTLILD